MFRKYLLLKRSGGSWPSTSMRELFGVTEMFYTLIRVVVTQVYTLVKTHQAVCLKWLHFITYKLSLNIFGFSKLKERAGANLIQKILFSTHPKKSRDTVQDFVLWLSVGPAVTGTLTPPRLTRPARRLPLTGLRPYARHTRHGRDHPHRGPWRGYRTAIVMPIRKLKT